MQLRCILFTVLVAFVPLFVCQSANGKTITLSPQSAWFETLSGESFQPGTEVVLTEGVYSDRRRLVIRQRGTQQKPIVFRAAAGARVVITRPDARQNTINLERCQYFTLRDLEITGGSAGIRIGGQPGHSAKFITLDGLHIHHTGGVAVTANFPGQSYQSLHLRRNHIHHTGGHGEAFYLGSNNDANGRTTGFVFDCMIEHNYIHDLKGPNVSQGDGIELKDGSYNNIIRDNVIHDTNYPGIIVYGTDGKAPNRIERNVIWNSADNGIQAAADAIIRNNIVYDSKGFDVYSRQHQSARVGKLQIINNTLLSEQSIRVIDGEGLVGRVVVANNAIGGQLRLPTSELLVATNNLNGVRELFPSPKSNCIGAADSEYLPKDDFNGTLRADSRDVGAYRFSAKGNPGWKIQAGIKP